MLMKGCLRWASGEWLGCDENLNEQPTLPDRYDRESLQRTQSPCEEFDFNVASFELEVYEKFSSLLLFKFSSDEEFIQVLKVSKEFIIFMLQVIKEEKY